MTWICVPNSGSITNKDSSSSFDGLLDLPKQYQNQNLLLPFFYSGQQDSQWLCNACDNEIVSKSGILKLPNPKFDYQKSKVGFCFTYNWKLPARKSHLLYILTNLANHGWLEIMALLPPSFFLSLELQTEKKLIRLNTFILCTIRPPIFFSGEVR